MPEATLTLISMALTLMVFSYLLGDLPLINHLYRIAVYIFVGMSAAFAAIVAFEGLLLPWWLEIQDPATSWTALGNDADVMIFGAALLLTLLLLLKPIAQLSWLTNSALAVVIAVATATAVVGALTGSLIPFLAATATLPANFTTDIEALFDAMIIVIGTMSGLYYFQWQTRREADGAPRQGHISRSARALGKLFIVVTLASIYAATMLTALTILIERVSLLFRFGGL